MARFGSPMPGLYRTPRVRAFRGTIQEECPRGTVLRTATFVVLVEDEDEACRMAPESLGVGWGCVTFRPPDTEYRIIFDKPARKGRRNP